MLRLYSFDGSILCEELNARNPHQCVELSLSTYLYQYGSSQSYRVKNLWRPLACFMKDSVLFTFESKGRKNVVPFVNIFWLWLGRVQRRTWNRPVVPIPRVLLFFKVMWWNRDKRCTRSREDKLWLLLTEGKKNVHLLIRNKNYVLLTSFALTFPRATPIKNQFDSYNLLS